MEGHVRCLRLELETRLSIEVTPAMDVWMVAWKVSRERQQEDSVRRLFRETVPLFPRGRIRDGIRQGRADARFVSGIWPGKTTESDEHLFATDIGVYTTSARQLLKHRPLRRFH